MIVEHEVIEQIELEENGRPLPWVCDLIRRLGRSDPLVVLLGMWREGYLTLADDVGCEMPQWRCAEAFRARDESLAVRVVATELGSRWVHGPWRDMSIR